MYRCGSGLQTKELAASFASANSVRSVWNRGFVKHPRAVKRRMGELAARTLRRRMLLLLLRQACVPSLEVAGVLRAEQAVNDGGRNNDGDGLVS